MNNQYRYVGQSLTPRMARELIQELFSGQTAQKQEIIRVVDETHLERGGLPKRAQVHPAEANFRLERLDEARIDLQRALPLSEEASDEELVVKIEDILYYIDSRTTGETQDE